MSDALLIAKYEYRRTVIRKGFLIGTMLIPIAMVAIIGLIIVFELIEENNLPVGYVDHSDILEISRLSSLPDDDRIEIYAYPNEDTAKAALEAGEIQAFWVIPPSYPYTLKTDLFFLEDPPSNEVWRDFDDFIRVNLIADLPEEIGDRLFEGPVITVQDLDNNRVFSERGIINIILPVVASFFFLVITMSTSDYMLRVVADEKENRTMEVMVTSVQPSSLIGGKTLGLLAASLTQLAIYIIVVVIGLKVASFYIVEIQQVTIPWGYIFVISLFFLPAYALIASVMVMIGSAVTERSQGQQIAGFLALLFLLPILMLPILFADPSGLASVIMTLFPPTAFMTISLRWGLGSVPIWQLIVSWTLLVATTIFMVWAAARVFRAGMLQYGQPLSFKTVTAVIRGT
jgi:ABC-2 type transport system permease protein